MQGASSLATGLGPIGFAFLFSAFSRTDSTLPYFPQVRHHGQDPPPRGAQPTIHAHQPAQSCLPTKVKAWAQDLLACDTA